MDVNTILWIICICLVGFIIGERLIWAKRKAIINESLVEIYSVALALNGKAKGIVDKYSDDEDEVFSTVLLSNIAKIGCFIGLDGQDVINLHRQGVDQFKERGGK